MMSKSSFLVSMIENNKRRLWVWVLSILSFVLVFPMAVALMVNRIERQVKDVVEILGDGAPQFLHRKLADGMCGIMGPASGLHILIAAIAVVIGVQGFSYLYSRKKIDFYLGMPIARKKRFLVIWVNGILIYFIPYLIGLFISILIAAGNGAMDKSVAITALTTFVFHFFFFLGIYHMTILAVMLTGNIVITGFGIAVFFLYELAIRWTVDGYRALFFRYYNRYVRDLTPFLSPFSMYGKLADTFNYYNTLDIKYLVLLLLFALFVGILCFICYLKRPAEAAGKAMVFEMTKPLIKILVMVPVILLAGFIMADAVNFTPIISMEGIGWVIFAMVIVAVVGDALMQTIYEFDIKGALHKKYHILISGALAAFVFFSFRYDLFGYDSYVPAQNKIASIAFVPEYYEMTDGISHFDSDGRYMSDQGYADQFMYLNNIGELLELAEISMENYNKIDWQHYQDYEKEMGVWSRSTMIYRLKSGRKITRSLWINVEDERTGQILDDIFGSEDFKKGFMTGASENLNKMLEQEDRYKISTTYGNLVYSEKMSVAQVKELLMLYQKDLALANFSNVRENVPVGIVNLSLSEEIPGNVYVNSLGEVVSHTREVDTGILIYPFYKETIAYLKEHGYYMDFQLNLEDVERIQIINHNLEIAEELQESMGKGTDDLAVNDPAALLARGSAESKYSSVIDTRVYVDYTKEEEFEKIAGCIYPRELVRNDWDKGKGLDENYEVIVYFRTDSDMTRNYGTYASYGFLEGEVPDFVKEDTAYKK